MADKRTPKFEQSMKQLEEIVAKLEAGNVDLDERVELFKKGMALARECETALKAAQEQVDSAMRNDGTVSSKDSADQDIPF
ncbi:MAG: exodeoxyribonuclease VII small subunit [Candidatus Eremiobacteraeota bacterium]|nr:exodeoxyribonuclease VII small subunit [Candidatus Eremiobacteraeota bacterium]